MIFTVMWNDIDLYREWFYILYHGIDVIGRTDAFRDFTSDPVTYPVSAMRRFIEELVC
jgi:hypothetical protein